MGVDVNNAPIVREVMEGIQYLRDTSRNGPYTILWPFKYEYLLKQKYDAVTPRTVADRLQELAGVSAVNLCDVQHICVRDDADGEKLPVYIHNSILQYRVWVLEHLNDSCGDGIDTTLMGVFSSPEEVEKAYKAIVASGKYHGPLNSDKSHADEFRSREVQIDEVL